MPGKGLLVAKGDGHQAERIHDVDDLLRALLEVVGIFALGRCIRADVDVDSPLGEFPAIDFVDDIVDIFQVIAVRDDLVPAREILCSHNGQNLPR